MPYIGPAGMDKGPIGETIRAAYREIASRRRKLTVPLALGLLDMSLEILAVKTEVGTEYVTPEGLEELKKTQTVVSPEVFKPAGESLQLTSKKARELGFVTYLAANRRDLAQALDLPPMGIEDDPSLEKPWKAVRIDLKGPITRRQRPASAKTDRRSNQPVRSEFHLPVDRKPRRLAGRQRRIGELFAHARSQPGSHGGVYSQRSPRRRRLDRHGLRPGGNAS